MSLYNLLFSNNRFTGPELPINFLAKTEIKPKIISPSWDDDRKLIPESDSKIARFQITKKTAILYTKV